MHWKVHLFRHFRLFQTFSHRCSHTPVISSSFLCNSASTSDFSNIILDCIRFRIEADNFGIYWNYFSNVSLSSPDCLQGTTWLHPMSMPGWPSACMTSWVLSVTTCMTAASSYSSLGARYGHIITYYSYTKRVFTREQSAKFEWSFELRIILMTVFWPVCMQITITKGHLNCAIQMMVQWCFPVTLLSNHAANSLYEFLDL